LEARRRLARNATNMMNVKDICYLVVGGAVLALVVYVVMCETGVTAPKSEAVMAWNSPLEDVPYSYFGSSHTLPGQQQVYLPHRYPDLSGTNISTLIHYGLSAMNTPHGDVAWMFKPPTEQNL